MSRKVRKEAASGELGQKLLDTIATLQAEVERLGVDSKRTREQDQPVPLSESEIAAVVDGALKKGIKMHDLISVFGPYAHGEKFRLKAVQRGGSSKWLAYDTKADAERARKALEATIKAEAASPVSEALTRYQGALTIEQKPGSVATKMFRLRGFFAPATEEKLSHLTPERGQQLLTALSRKESRQGRQLTEDERKAFAQAWGVKLQEVPKRLIAYATLKGTVSAVKDFMAWAQKEGLGARKDVFADLVAPGRRAPRKPALRLDEAKAWLEKAHEMAKEGDQDAIAALAVFDLGVRSGEVTGRLVRDLTKDGAMLFVEEAKTTSSEGYLDVGEDVQPYLVELARGREPQEKLFSRLDDLKDSKGWLLRAVVKVAAAAGVQRVTPHGLRRTAMTIVARTRGMKAASILAGHTDTGVTTGHYVDPAVGRAEVQDRLRKLTKLRAVA